MTARRALASLVTFSLPSPHNPLRYSVLCSHPPILLVARHPEGPAYGRGPRTEDVDGGWDPTGRRTVGTRGGERRVMTRAQIDRDCYRRTGTRMLRSFLHSVHPLAAQPDRFGSPEGPVPRPNRACGA